MRNLRPALWSVVLTLALLATTACGGQSQPATGNPAPAAPAPAANTSQPATAAPQLEPTLTVAGAGGSLQQAMEQQILPLFEKKFGVKVTYQAATSAQSLAQTQANRNNPPYDVIWGSEQTHVQGKTAGLWQPVDPTVVTNFKNVYPEFQDPDKVGVPLGFVVVGLEYNSKIFKDKGFTPPTSWQDLWNPAYKNHVGAYAWSVAFSPALLFGLAKNQGGSDTTAAFDKLKGLAPNLVNVFPDPGSLDNSLAQGDTWITYNSSARVQQASQSGQPLKFVAPNEGAVYQGSMLDIPINAAHPKAAQAFLNFWLSPEVQQLLPKALGYAPVIPNVTIPSDLAEYVPSPDSRKQLVFVDWKVIAQRNQELSQQWDKSLQK